MNAYQAGDGITNLVFTTTRSRGNDTDQVPRLAAAPAA